MEWLLAAITLRLLDADHLAGGFNFDAEKVQVEGVHLAQSVLRLDVARITVLLDMARDLEVVLLLANESVVAVGKVEALIGVHSEVW